MVQPLTVDLHVSPFAPEFLRTKRVFARFFLKSNGDDWCVGPQEIINQWLQQIMANLGTRWAPTVVLNGVITPINDRREMGSWDEITLLI